ncbi:hypothetical protein [Microvirga makkahensis]|uniref:Uncharacterized protein n=1 Tax=Microvirga makkahensis TaxID=1128670 RepID=A0A7X3MPH3_9HYPH|nr:hypothetical protein [Microvirga makkahensis]MXQ10831.1 hypothetical protein [Microvirga makkahensis]
MTALLAFAVVAAMTALIVPPVFRVLTLDREARMELKGNRIAFAPE